MASHLYSYHPPYPNPNIAAGPTLHAAVSAYFQRTICTLHKCAPIPSSQKEISNTTAKTSVSIPSSPPASLPCSKHLHNQLLPPPYTCSLTTIGTLSITLSTTNPVRSSPSFITSSPQHERTSHPLISPRSAYPANPCSFTPNEISPLAILPRPQPTLCSTCSLPIPILPPVTSDGTSPQMNHLCTSLQRYPTPETSSVSSMLSIHPPSIDPTHTCLVGIPL